MCENKKKCNCGCSTKKPLTESISFKRKFLKEDSKLELNESTKKDLVKQSKIAMDALYSLYEICDKNKIAPEKLLKHVDEGFKNINEVINLLAIQD